MSKFQKLAQINKIANECVQDGDFELASKFHNEFLKVAQFDTMQPDPQVDLGQPAIQFIGALNKCPNFTKIISGAPTRENIPTYRPDASASTIRLVQELLGISPDGSLGPKTLSAMQTLLQKGQLDSMLTNGFKRKFNL